MLKLFTTWHLLIFGAIFIIWYLRRPAFASLIIYEKRLSSKTYMLLNVI